MAKYCPVVGHRVVYLTCLECEDKVCMRPSVPVEEPQKKANNDNDNLTNEEQAAPAASTNKCEADCKKCCHNISVSEEKIGAQTFMISRCQVYRNYLLQYKKVQELGCEHFNKDYSQERICMNCAHYLGGGDWGLACSAHYHRLPSALDPACESFKKREK